MKGIVPIALLVASAPVALRAQDRAIPDAVLVLEAAVGMPGRITAAAPPRFVMMRGGRVFVGGSEDLYAGVLGKDDQKAIERRVKDLRKAKLLVPTVSFGGDTSKRYRLRILEDDPVDVAITGDPASAPATQRPLAAFVQDLLTFDHPDLRPYAPDAFALQVRVGELVGGCRPWGFSVPLEEALASRRRIAPSEAESWPTGASPASVCSGGRRYVVTLRPLLPGELP